MNDSLYPQQQLNLANVTLVAADSAYVDRTVLAMSHCLRQACFRNAILFTDWQIRVPGVTVVPIPPLPSTEEYSKFMLCDLPVYRDMFAPFILIVQYDGFILNPAAWSDTFYEYDYIGAPWPGGAVGNGGFSLRSRNLLEALARLQLHPHRVHPEDRFLAYQLRPGLEAENIRFAPTEVAAQFSVENVPYADSFGYHGGNTARVSGISLDCLDAVSPAASLEELYYRAKYAPSDLNAHVDTLRRLGTECGHITEFCSKTGDSTAAFLYARPGKLVSYNEREQFFGPVLSKVADEAGVSFELIAADVLDTEIEETDLLFIDTRHVYEQTRRELALHAARVRKLLVLHDTTTFGALGEDGKQPGILAAVHEFLRDHSEWFVEAKYENSHGLMILRRVTLASEEGAASS